RSIRPGGAIPDGDYKSAGSVPIRPFEQQDNPVKGDRDTGADRGSGHVAGTGAGGAWFGFGHGGGSHQRNEANRMAHVRPASRERRRVPSRAERKRTAAAG